MPTILLRFPGGRYHATPWGYHVNEGQIEWPPCPWRLLRALIATGFATRGWEDVPPVARRMIEALARVLPTYQLPLASAAHSRHYMPIGELSKGVEKTTLVFDTWANVGDGLLAIRWDCELDQDATTLFHTLVASLGYLGRSESWVDACVAPDDFEFDEDYIALPVTEGEYRDPQWEQVPLLAAVDPDVYLRWYAEKAETVDAQLPLPEGNRKPTQALLKKRAAALAPFPTDLLDCLQKDTAWWKKQHSWSQPPGSRRVLYWRPVNSLVVSRPGITRAQTARPVGAILLALSTPSRRTAALPHVQRTLPQGELFHRAMVGRVGNGQMVHCPELTGRDAAGEPLQQGHRHAHVLPLDLDGDARIDHLLVYAPMGLGDAAQQAVRSLKRTWTKGGVGELQVSVVGRGDLDALRQLAQPLDQAIQRLLGSPQGSQIWTSATPFVPPRFVKPRGRNTIEGQIQAELASRNLPPAERIELLPDKSIEIRDFVRVRRHGGTPPPQDVGYAIRIELAEPIQGPLTLGYGSHFGLGRFSAETR
jgi:CRISPR-associated protein Csb2